MPRLTRNSKFYYVKSGRKAKKTKVTHISSGPIYKSYGGVKSFKVRGSVGVSSNASGEISGNWSNDPSTYSDWSGISSLYDTFKVTGIKVHYIPSLPNDTSTVTGFWPLYVAIDQNDAVTPTTVATMLDYDNMRVFNMYRPWKVYRKVYNQSAISGSTVLAGGYRPIGTTTATAAIKYYGNGFDLSTSYGQVIVTLYIKAKERR